LYLIDIHGFGKLFFDARFLFARNPDFQFRIKVKRAGSLHAESGDTFVGYGPVFYFTACDALFFDQDQSLGGKNKDIPDQLEAHFNILAINQKSPKIFGKILFVDMTGVA